MSPEPSPDASGRKDDARKSHPDLAGAYNAADKMPTNVSDLLIRAQLDNARDVYKLIESRSELNAYQDRELAVKVINNLIDYHAFVIDTLIEQSKAERVVSWTMDLSRLRQAVELLEAVDLCDD